MKIVLIGHPCIDIIHKNENITEAIGGVIYSALGFYLIGENRNCVLPILNINDEYRQKFIEFFNKLDFSTEYFQNSERGINKVHLFFEKNSLSFECYQEKAEKISIKLIPEEVFETSHFLINMISGFELELNDLLQIRAKTQNIIYLDFHTLTRAMDEKGKRYYSPIPNVEQWISACDIIQMNNLERESLFSETLTEEEFVNKVFKLGCKIINITKSENGAVSYVKVKDSIQKYESMPLKEIEVKNVVGCGDIFGSTFFYLYCNKIPVEVCLRSAVDIASKRSEMQDIEEIIKSKNLFNEWKILK